MLLFVFHKPLSKGKSGVFLPIWVCFTRGRSSQRGARRHACALPPACSHTSLYFVGNVPFPHTPSLLVCLPGQFLPSSPTNLKFYLLFLKTADREIADYFVEWL